MVRTLVLLLSPCLCVHCHSIVDLGLCVCGRVVSLWNGGDGLCVGWNGGVCCVHVAHVVVTVRVLSCCIVLWVVEWRWCAGVMVLSLLFSVLFFFFLFVLVFGGSARAALRARTLSPNTIVLSCCLLFLSVPLLAFLGASSFYCLEWRRVCLPGVGVFGGHDGDG